MEDSYLNLMENVEFGDAVSVERILEVENEMGIKFPMFYKSFMQNHNGAEGEVGKNSYLAIWTIDEIAELNRDYGVNDFTPGLVYFGSDGGRMAFAFDMRNEKINIVEFPTDSIHIEDAIYISDSFEGFIKALYNR